MTTRPLFRSLFLTALAALVMAGDARAQDLHPSRRPSPLGVARTHLSDTYVKITYGRPYMRGRAVFGTNTGDATFLVPLGQVWRLGANEATELTVTNAVLIAGKRLEAGTYSLFAVPGPDRWAIHVSPQLGLDGTGMLDAETGAFTANVYDPGQDVLIFDAMVESLDEDVDQFTIRFESSDDGAHILMSWERTQVRVPVQEAPSG
jgi:hypothetical protein